VRKLNLSFLMLVSCLLIFAACSKKPEENDKRSNEPPDEKESISDAEEEKFYFPLTGMETSEQSTQRAVAAMINNHPDARPQSGLSQADIVYEILAEGNVTRFLAIFQSEEPESIGPIRSARDYYIDLAEGYDGLYVAHGYSPEAEEILSSGRIDHLNGMRYDGTLFKRASFRKAPHNSYTTFDSIEEGATKEGYDMETSPASLSFYNRDEVDQLSGDKANKINISYGQQFNNEYHYDQQSGRYSRSTDQNQTVEYDSGNPIQVDNLIVIETAHQVIDSAGRRKIDLTSGGKALLFQNGMLKELEWENRDGRLLPIENGNPAKLVPGKTWISVVPSMDYVTYNE
jgi:hypothetical protein